MQVSSSPITVVQNVFLKVVAMYMYSTAHRQHREYTHASNARIFSRDHSFAMYCTIPVEYRVDIH